MKELIERWIDTGQIQIVERDVDPKFEYADGKLPNGLEQAGYTDSMQGVVVASEVDSDVFEHQIAQRSNNLKSSSSSLAVSSEFTVEAGAIVHRADAGVIGDPKFEPAVELSLIHI